MRFLWVCAGFALSALVASPAAEADFAKLPPATKGGVDYAADIQPILSRNCYSCHGLEKHKAGLRLDSKTGALAGGDSGKVIQPGNSAESKLIHLVAGLDPDAVM